MKSNRIFGEIEGVLEGDVFKNRVELSVYKVHKPRQSGISGSENEGADSVVISGGYEDDEDFGNVIIYTGQGGRSNDSKSQVADQTLTKGNKGLVVSHEKQLPVRVIRGVTDESNASKKKQYRYDGLYSVVNYKSKVGKSGFVVWVFRLEKIRQDKSDDVDFGEIIVQESDLSYGKSDRKDYVINRLVRETRIAQSVKKLYDNRCQICGLQIKTPVAFYAEAAHIKGLGQPHNGPDIEENCPNHHIMFDLGVIAINDDFSILGLDSVSLMVHPDHKIGKEFIEYHREYLYKKQQDA